jgi:hypothetical protein
LNGGVDILAAESDSEMIGPDQEEESECGSGRDAPKQEYQPARVIRRRDNRLYIPRGRGGREPEVIRSLSDFIQFGAGKSMQTGREPIFALQIGSEDAGIVCIERDRNAGVKETAHGMRGARGNDPGSDIACDRDFKRHPIVS